MQGTRLNLLLRQVKNGGDSIAGKPGVPLHTLDSIKPSAGSVVPSAHWPPVYKPSLQSAGQMKAASLHSPPVYRPISAMNVQPQVMSNRQRSIPGAPVARGVESRPAPPVYRPANFLQPQPSRAFQAPLSDRSSVLGGQQIIRALLPHPQAPTISGLQVKKTQARPHSGFVNTLQLSKDSDELKGSMSSAVAAPSVSSGASGAAAADESGPMASPLLLAAFAALHLLSDGAAENASPQPSHFSRGADVAITYTRAGALRDPDEGRAASVPKRKALYKALGMGEHVLAGHFFLDATLISQARMGHRNFTWSSDQALVTAVNKAAFVFRWRVVFYGNLADAGDKRVTVNIGRDDGHGYVVGTDHKLYKVAPKYARVIAKTGGDFNTAYGVTEETDPSRFALAYHVWEEVT